MTYPWVAYRRISKPLAQARSTGVALYNHLTETLQGSLTCKASRKALLKLRGAVQRHLTATRHLERQFKYTYDYNYRTYDVRKLFDSKIFLLNEEAEFALLEVEAVFAEHRASSTKEIFMTVALRSLVYAYFSQSLHAYSTLKAEE